MGRITTAGVISYIRDRILNFSLLPGVKISDQEVAEVFQISRSPVRIALTRLVEQGLVEYHPNRGFTVKVFTRKEVQDYYQLRESLETMAVRLAIESIGDEQINTLDSLLKTYPALIEADDIVRFNECDEQFHELIALYSNNNALHRAIQNLRGVIRIMRRYDHLRPGNMQIALKQHQLILKHMVKRDVGKAEEAMSSHIRMAMHQVMDIVPDQS